MRECYKVKILPLSLKWITVMSVCCSHQSYQDKLVSDNVACVLLPASYTELSS